MTTSRARATGLSVLAVLALLLSGCGAGGFGTKEPETVTSKITSYVALGDGFTAAPYVGKSTDKSGCLRSEQNYPNRVATALGVTTFTDVSCTGATTEAITDAFRPAGAKRDVKAQLDAVTKDTDLVTIGIGIEDGNLLASMFRICSAVPCPNKASPKAVRAQLLKIATDLPATIRAVTAKAPQAYIVVVGYPELLPFEADCKAVPAMDTTGFGFATYTWQQLNTTIGSSARQAGAAYIDVRRLSENHAPCSKDPWMNDLKTVAGKRLAYHPVAAEQKAVAEAVIAQVRTR